MVCWGRRIETLRLGEKVSWFMKNGIPGSNSRLTLMVPKQETGDRHTVVFKAGESESRWTKKQKLEARNCQDLQTMTVSVTNTQIMCRSLSFPLLFNSLFTH